MNQQLKTRLVGAIVLISLAVILLPFLLDGSGQGPSVARDGFVPDRPGYRFEPLEIPLQLPPPAPAVELISDEWVADQVRQDGDTPAPAPAPSGPAPANQTTAAPAIVRPAPTPTTPVAPPASRLDTAVQGGWVVQVGSFSLQQNANALSERLRAQGFSSFVDESRSASGIVWRVRVGPESQRDRAERLQQRLKSEMQLQGIVMAHGS